MSAALCAAADTLAMVLERENQALRTLDLAAAGALLAEKTHAIDGFLTVQKVTQIPAAGSKDRALAEVAAARLERLTTENRHLLDRAVTVQGRVLAVIARAIPAADASAYGPPAAHRCPRPAPVALSARA